MDVYCFFLVLKCLWHILLQAVSHLLLQDRRRGQRFIAEPLIAPVAALLIIIAVAITLSTSLQCTSLTVGFRCMVWVTNVRYAQNIFGSHTRSLCTMYIVQCTYGNTNCGFFNLKGATIFCVAFKCNMPPFIERPFIARSMSPTKIYCRAFNCHGPKPVPTPPPQS